MKDEREEIIVRLPTELRQKLRAVAVRLGLSDNEVIIIAITAFVEDRALHAVIREIMSGSYYRRRRPPK